MRIDLGNLGFIHVGNVSFQISLRSPHRLILDNTFCLNSTFG